ncbi:MAG: glycosyltransferase family 2 protein [Actinobacteria bacterium]|nr:glycosyltransferase family 2 protein [Actinomycetota bacterium]NBP12527.1 glycosyltransferase family 2 protein [Actinomycetota bacterium]NDF93043.1 glycosyltransferase family 2 protein [Actinomycetota bacterium]
MTSPFEQGNTANQANYPPVSIILTVINEALHLRAALKAALSSNYQGELEVILAVGPSTDKTLKIANEIASQDSRVKVIENKSGRTPSGLNAALKMAKNEIVVRIDGHSEIDKEYIRQAVETLRKTGAVNVGGVMFAQGVTSFEKAVAAAMRSPIGVGSSRFHIGGVAGPTDTVYLGVFQKSALDAVGGYDERFTRAQDWELNYRLRKNGGVVYFDPALRVIYRPRSSLKKLALQYFEYGRWRRAVVRQHSRTINFRYLAPPLNLILQVSSLVLALSASPLFLIPIISYLGAITLTSLIIGKGLAQRIYLPIVLIFMHFCWGFGFITSPRKLITN